MGTSFSIEERARDLARLHSPEISFDLCIVGGGATGAAIARDAALRGWKVLLLEKGDFAGGTSSRSSKLIHGGVRYLEQYEFGLVRESTRERARLWRSAPQLVQPLPFLFPAFKGARVPLWKLDLGLWLYDLLATFRTPTLHRRYGRARTEREEPLLAKDGLTGSIFYWDAITDDALLTLANVIDARAAGATMLSRTECLDIRWHPEARAGDGALHEVRFKDLVSGHEGTARAKTFVVAAGPWTDRVSHLLPEQSASHAAHRVKAKLAPTRGSHIVVPAKRLPVKHAIVMMHPQDGRVLFTIPWGESTVLGTTDLFDSADPDQVAVNADEVDYLVDAARRYFPTSDLTKKDVLSTWSGLRPLLAPPDEESASAVSREHSMDWDELGCLVIAGGKLTTHREMAEQAVERIYDRTGHWKQPPGPGYAPCPTVKRPLPTLVNRHRPELRALGKSEASRLDVDLVRDIVRTEMVLSIEDLLVRRTHVFFHEPDNGRALLPLLKDVLCEMLGWKPAEWERQCQAYLAYVERNVDRPLGR